MHYIGNLPESQVGCLVIADYILYALNKMGTFRYIHFAGLKEPSDCILSVLASTAARLKFVSEVRSAECKDYHGFLIKRVI